MEVLDRVTTNISIMLTYDVYDAEAEAREIVTVLEDFF